MNQDNEKLLQIREELRRLYESKKQVNQLKKEENQNFNQYQTNDNGQSMGNFPSKTETKTLTLSNGHSILGDNKGNGGFTNLFIMSLLVGFAGGAITTAIYIFINLSKFTFSL